MSIETNATTSGGAEAGGSAHQSSMAQAGAPEVRSERIAAIQAAIANGTYQVSAEQTAEAILAEHQVRDESAA